MVRLTVQKYGAAVSPGDELRTYLQRSFFDDHRRLYENRPIYFPLSSAKKSFVADVSIHRWRGDTLSALRHNPTAFARSIGPL